MKKTIVAVLLGAAVGQANATILMYMNNQNGGTIQFSDLSCKTFSEKYPRLSGKGGYAGMTLDGDGHIIGFGCWQYQEPNVTMNWEDGDTRFYPQGAVTFTKEGRRLFDEAAKAKPTSSKSSM